MAYTKYGQKSSALQPAGSAKSSGFVLNPEQNFVTLPHGLWSTADRLFMGSEHCMARIPQLMKEKIHFFWVQKYFKKRVL